MMTKLVRCILGISVCAGLAQAETLERVISREDWKFDCAAAGMSVGRDGNVYLCSSAPVGRGAYVLRVSRDGTQKAGGDVAWDGLAAYAVANANGLVAAGNGHFQHHLHIYDRNFVHVAECGDFPGLNGLAPPVAVGASGDFYGLHAPQNRIVRVSPVGAIAKTYTVPKEARGGGFRVCEATETFVVRGNDGVTRGVSFSGELKWAQKIPALFDVDAAGRVVFLDGTTLKWLEPDDLNPGAMEESQRKVSLPADQIVKVNAIAVFGDELILKRANPAELFQVYDLATGKQKRVVYSEYESVTAEFPNGVWTAGQPVPFRIQCNNASAQWHVWATAFGDADWRDLKWAGDQLAVPADFAGLYQIRVAPTLNAQAASEFTLNTVVEVRAPNSKGTVSVWSPLNRIWWGRGEELPVAVAVRPTNAVPAVAVSLRSCQPERTETSPQKTAEILRFSPNDIVWSNGVGRVVVPASFTAKLASGRYELRADAPGFTCVAQPIRIGPGLAVRSPFRTMCYGDYGNFNSTADAWSFADVADDMLAQSLALGINQYINRTVFYRYPLAFADSANARGLFTNWDRRLAAEPDGVATQKVAFGFPQAHVLGAYGAYGVREWLLLVGMDADLSGGTVKNWAGGIPGTTQGMKDFPAFAGWDWVANWWPSGNRFVEPPPVPKTVVKPAMLGEATPGEKDQTLDALADSKPKPPPLTEKQRYEAALKKANETGAWDSVLDAVGDRAINWQTDAQQAFKAAMDSVATNLSTASSGPYRRPEIYPPVSFSNVDEVDLHYQGEQYTTPNWTAHATDYYKRPGKPAWIHPEFLMNETGTGEHILPFTWMAVMRGVDGIGISGVVPGNMRSVFRALDEFAKQYGPWLTTLENHDRVAIVVSHRQVKLDGFGGFGGRYFVRLWEAFQSCLYAHQPATFLFTEDVKPDTLRRFKALLVVGQQYEPEPPLAELLAAAKRQGIAIFADGTCRESLVKDFTPLGVAFDHVEKLNGFNNENAFTEFPEVLLANAPLVAAKLGGVVPPVAVVDQPEVFVSERSQGDARYVWVVNNTPIPLNPGLLRRVGTAIATRQPVVAKVSFPVAKGDVVYDVFDGKEVSSQPPTVNVAADLRYSQARLYAVLPGAIQKLELQSPQELKAGQSFAWKATVPGIKATLPLHVELRDSRGALLDERFTTTGTGTFTVPINAALPVSLAATELISGKTASTGPRPADLQPLSSLFGPRLRDIAISLDGGTALLNAFDWGQNLYALDLATGKVRWTGNVGDHFASAPLATRDGFVVRGYDLATAEGFHLYRLDAAGQVTRRFAIPGIPSRFGGADNFAVAPGGDWIAGAGNLALAVWSADGKLLWSQDWSTTNRVAPRLLTLGTDQLVLGRGMTISAFEARTGRALWTVTPAADGEIVGMDASADGRTVVARATTRSGRVFVVRDGKTVGMLPTGADAAVVSADGSWVIVTTGRELKRYAADGGLQWVNRADDTLRSPRLSPDGKRLAAGSELGKLCVFDVNSGSLRTRDLGALPVPAWTPDGDLVVATWMGTVRRLDRDMNEKWQVKLGGAPVQTIAAGSVPAVRLTSWLNAETQPLPLTPNLLTTTTVVRAVNGGRGVGLENPVPLLFDGQTNAPANAWMSWGAVVSIDFWHGPFTLEIDVSPARLRVTAVTLVEDPAHPESWVRDTRLEYWDETQKTWVLAQYLTSDAAVHSHKLRQPVEASKFRFARPDGAGWPVGSLRLAEVVFHGEKR